MRFTCAGRALEVAPRHLIVAGWTGRDRAAVEHHIAELAAIGVAPPSKVPLFYPVAAALLTQEETIEVVGPRTSGEVEPLIVRTGGRLYLGLASDHTDRALEAHSVALSKQACAKPCAGEVWDFEEVAGHFDAIELRSWIGEGSEWTLYQEGRLAAIRPLDALIGEGLAGLGEGEDAAMLAGTLAVLSGGVRPAAAFRMEMHDPVRGRTIRHGYRIEALPVVA